MKRILERKKARIACAAVLSAVWICQPVYAAEQLPAEVSEEASVDRTDTAGWRQVENLWYYYDESGRMQTGWIQAEDGLWYELDTEDGSWVRRPALNTEAAVHLLENAIKKQGYYQNEQQPVVVREDGRNGNLIYMSVRIVTGPNDDQILNTYEVNRKSGRVKAAVGGSFNLYDSGSKTE